MSLVRRRPDSHGSPRPEHPRPAPPGAAPPATPASPTFRPLERPNYFHGQLLGAADLTLEQSYFIDRARRHNMALHGSGVVCGLEVTLDDGQVRVAPGLALDCAGNEIVLARAMTCPLPEQSESLFVVVSFAEMRTGLVPVLGEPDTPGEVAAPSRIVEDAAFALEPADPCAGHARRGACGQACGAAHGLSLARLVRDKRGWKRDPKFEPLRCRA